MTAKTHILSAEGREITGKKVKRLRSKQALPAVVYGQGIDSRPLTIDLKEYKKLYAEAGTSALVDLTIGQEKPIKVLLHEPQRHHLNLEPIHADFYAVKMSQKIDTAIPINFTGTSMAVEELEGNLVVSKDELSIRCLPGDLIPAVEVDLSVLKTFDDQIRVGDIAIPDTIEVMHEPDEVIASVEAPRSEEELEAELTQDTAEAEKAATAELGKQEDEAAESEAGSDEPAESR
jgi:large subunit ribosomal protein L25